MDKSPEVPRTWLVSPPQPRLRVSQSSTGFGGSPDRAVDGGTNGSFKAGSVTHTVQQDYAWWQVDLGKIENVTQVTIFNRTDCCSERLSNFYLFASAQPFTSNDPGATVASAGVWKYYHRGNAGAKLAIPVASRARYLRIQLTAKGGYLSLAEVQVATNAATKDPPQPVKLEGLWKLDANGYPGQLEFARTATGWTGRIFVNANGVWEPLSDIAFAPESASLSFVRQAHRQRYSGTVEGSRITGRFEGGGASFSWSASR
jgi:hypothetical protein